MDSTLIELSAAPGPHNTADHFIGQAAFLRDVPLFQFQAMADGFRQSAKA